MENILFMVFMVRMVFGSCVSRCFQQLLYFGRYKCRSWCFLCCLRHTKVHNFSSTKFALDQLFVTNNILKVER